MFIGRSRSGAACAVPIWESLSRNCAAWEKSSKRGRGPAAGPLFPRTDGFGDPIYRERLHGQAVNLMLKRRKNAEDECLGVAVSEDSNHRAVVQLNWDKRAKQWLLTAYERRGFDSPPGGRTSDISPSLGAPSGRLDDTAPQSSSESAPSTGRTIDVPGTRATERHAPPSGGSSSVNAPARQGRNVRKRAFPFPWDTEIGFSNWRRSRAASYGAGAARQSLRFRASRQIYHSLAAGGPVDQMPIPAH
jgi:hypothetical protein